MPGTTIFTVFGVVECDCYLGDLLLLHSTFPIRSPRCSYAFPFYCSYVTTFTTYTLTLRYVLRRTLLRVVAHSFPYTIWAVAHPTVVPCRWLLIWVPSLVHVVHVIPATFVAIVLITDGYVVPLPTVVLIHSTRFTFAVRRYV